MSYEDQLQTDFEGEDFALIEEINLEGGELRVDGATFWTVEQAGDAPDTAKPVNKNMNVAVKSDDDRSPEERAAKLETLKVFYAHHKSGEGWQE